MSVGDAPIRVFDELKESFDGHLEIDANGPKGSQAVTASGGAGDAIAPLAGPRGKRRGRLREDAEAQDRAAREKGTEESSFSREHSEAVNPDGARDVELFRAEAQRLLGKDAVALEAKGDLQFAEKASDVNPDWS